jgi:hypothetical protein
VNAKRTSTVADSSIRSTTTRRTSRRPSRLALLRVKVATLVVAVVLFFASLTGIAIYNPQVGNQAVVPVQAQQITIVKPDGSDSLVLPPPPRVSAVRPLVRSRGS